MSKLCDLKLSPIFSTEKMRSLDVASKTFIVQTLKAKPSEQDVIQSGYSLMKEAGLALFKFVKAKIFAEDNSSKSIAIFIGGGNNGGDGLVLAKHLIQAGIKIVVFSLSPTNKFKNEAKLAFDDFTQAGGQLCDFIEWLDKGFDKLSSNDFKLVVDCMLGSGSKGELRPNYAKAVQIINESNLPIIAADAPTGYDSKAQICHKICIQAKDTMLFGFPRLDAYSGDACEKFGNIIVAELSYPKDLVKKFCVQEPHANIYFATEDSISSLLPKRNETKDKRTQGCAAIVAGSKFMPGAAKLCTEACLRSGTGLVTLATPASILPILQTKLSEPVFCDLQWSQDYFDSKDVPRILELCKHNQAIAIGPGITTKQSVSETLYELLPQITIPMVLDADALNIIAYKFNRPSKIKYEKNSDAVINYLKGISAPAILTPHVREFARLFGDFSPANAVEKLKQIVKSTNKTIILKGSPIFIAVPESIDSPQVKIYMIPANNSGLAKGGSGDVLTGIIAALLAQRLSTGDAAVLGALLHQKAGRITREKLGALSMLPSDVINQLHKAFST